MKHFSSLPLSPSQRKTENNKYRIGSLFLEINTSFNLTPFFTLSSEDKVKTGRPVVQEGPVDGDKERTYVSIKNLYMKYYYDPTEYQFVMNVLGDFKLWEAMSGNERLAPYIEEWRKEAEIKLRSEAIKEVVEVAKTEGAKGFTAAKWLAEAKWKSSGGAGRPKNREDATQNEIESKLSKEVELDIRRLGVHK